MVQGKKLAGKHSRPRFLQSSRVRNDSRGTKRRPAMPEQNDICARCGGQCCKGFPGIYWPEDIRPLTEQTIGTMITDKIACVDWWEGSLPNIGESEIRFLRARAINDHGAIVGSRGGQCVHLTENGCTLAYAQRPRECRELIPRDKEDAKCVFPAGVSKEAAAVAWLPYQSLLKSIVQQAEKR